MATVQRPDSAEVSDALEAGLAALEARARELNDLNVFPVADGDTGTNMLLTAAAAVTAARDARRPELSTRIARAALEGARGNSGMILSQLLRGAAEVLDGARALDGPLVARALRGASRAADAAVREPVEGTMLTVARAMADAAERRQAAGWRPALAAAIAEGWEAVARTRDQLDRLRTAGVVDSGGLGLVVLLDGVTAHLEGRDPAPPPERVVVDQAAIDHPPSRFRYCTTFIVDGPGVDVDRLEREMEGLGDSLLVMGDPLRAKVHVHTDEPDRALTRAAALGAVGPPSIEDMRRQSAERAARLAAAARLEERRACGALVLSPSPEFDAIVLGLGGVGVREGDDAELARLAATMAADELVLVAAPGRAAEGAVTVESASPVEALAAMVVFDGARGAEANREEMAEAAAAVLSVEVDRTADGAAVARWPGGELAAAGLPEVVRDLAGRMAEEGRGLLTVLIGRNAGCGPAEVEAWARAGAPAGEVEAHDGGLTGPALLIGAE
jgi:DAK2 domain fusion protein YloV